MSYTHVYYTMGAIQLKFTDRKWAAPNANGVAIDWQTITLYSTIWGDMVIKAL